MKVLRAQIFIRGFSCDIMEERQIGAIKNVIYH